MNRDIQRFILASAAVALGGAIVIGLFFRVVPESNQRIMDLATGIVLGWGGLALSFYFGTSASSAHKTELLEQRPTGTPGDPVHTEEERYPAPGVYSPDQGAAQ